MNINKAAAGIKTLWNREKAAFLRPFETAVVYIDRLMAKYEKPKKEMQGGIKKKIHQWVNASAKRQSLVLGAAFFATYGVVCYASGYRLNGMRLERVEGQQVAAAEEYIPLPPSMDEEQVTACAAEPVKPVPAKQDRKKTAGRPVRAKYAHAGDAYTVPAGQRYMFK